MPSTGIPRLWKTGSTRRASAGPALRPCTAITQVAEAPSVSQPGKSPSGEGTFTSRYGTPAAAGVACPHIQRSK